MNRIPVLLLTGFLGSGKTTVLNRLLADPAFRDTLAIINESGAVGIDHLLVEKGTEDILLLEGGCMCCRMRSSLSETIRSCLRQTEAGARASFRRIVIETSGLADPIPILQDMIADIGFGRRCTLSGIVTSVDAATASNTLDRHPEAVAQVAVADVILVSKTDLVTSAERAELDRRLSALNCEATRFEACFGAVDPACVWPERLGLSEAWLARAQHASRTGGPGAGVATAALAFEGMLDGGAVESWLEETVATLGPHLLRLKGVLNIVGSRLPVVIHGVQHLVHAPSTLPRWPAGHRHSRLVLIGRDIDQDILDDAIRRLAARARSVGPPEAAMLDSALPTAADHCG